MTTKFNRITLVGRLASEPKGNVQQGNKHDYASARIAVERSFTDRNGKAITDFFLLKAFGSMAKIITNYGVKGAPVLVSGELQSDSYNGETFVYIQVTEFQLLESVAATKQRRSDVDSPKQSEELATGKEVVEASMTQSFGKETALDGEPMVPEQPTPQSPFDDTPKVLITGVDPSSMVVTGFYQNSGKKVVKAFQMAQLMEIQSRKDNSRDGTLLVDAQRFEAGQL